MNLGDGGPDSGAALSLSPYLPSLCGEFLRLAVVIWTRHRSCSWFKCSMVLANKTWTKRHAE